MIDKERAVAILKIFYGRFWGISDLMDFQSESPQALEDEFHKAVDDYLAFCAETGKTPQRERYSLKMITVVPILLHPVEVKHQGILGVSLGLAQRVPVAGASREVREINAEGR